MRSLTLSLLFFLSINLFAQDVIEGVSLDRLKHLEEFINTEIDEDRISGAATLIHRRNQTIYQKAFGLSDKKTAKPMEMDNIFYIQSMTKPIITVAFMQLYEQGHFNLWDPVEKFIPEFKNLRVAQNPQDGKEGKTDSLSRRITIVDLLTHTAGLTHGLGGTALDQDFFMEQYTKPYGSIRERVDNLLTFPLVGQPGKQWYYSSAPDILSVLIEQFSGIPTDQYLQENIFDPLGMEDTGYNLTSGQKKRIAKLHRKDEAGNLVTADEGALGGSDNQTTIWSGVNGLWSTPADYLVFCRMVLNNGQYGDARILGRKTVEMMRKNHVGDLFAKGAGFGLGYAVITDIAANQMIGSDGTFWWAGAYNTHFFIDPEEELIAIFMTQLEPYTNTYHEKLRLFVSQAIVD